MQKSNNYGLQALTPMYGQVITTAPTWSGPFEAPPVPAARGAPPVSDSQFYTQLFGNIGATTACAILAPEFALGCPLVGLGAGSILKNIVGS
jgi:hypothetical protein